MLCISKNIKINILHVINIIIQYENVLASIRIDIGPFAELDQLVKVKSIMICCNI